MITTLVCLLEESSAKAFLEGVVARMLPTSIEVKYITFEGKQDLEKQLAMKMRVWQTPDSAFLIMRDQDAARCKDVKERLLSRCQESGKEKYLVRIACHELESFYFGDLTSVEAALKMDGLQQYAKRAMYRTPDNIINPSRELDKITRGRYQKVSGSKAIGKLISIGENSSHSFHALISGLYKLCEIEGNANAI